MPARRPNVLRLFPDQLRHQALGCNGDANAHTRHTGRLAGEFLAELGL